jgi:hypothetical protein
VRFFETSVIFVRATMDSITSTGQALKLVAVTTTLIVCMPARAVSLSETVTDSHLSGERGLEAHVAEPDGTTHAIYGITSAEFSDDPCLVTVRKVHISNRASKADFPRDWCGSKRATSSLLSVQYADGNKNFTSDRVFVTGVQVCMNSSGDKVKGFRLRGREITPQGSLQTISVAATSGPLDVNTAREPQDFRTNCQNNDKGWRSWAECPSGALATAAILHFDGGAMPRSLVGIQLKCRQLLP